ncbi:hypothetical protein [Acinetobacter gerneri]|uniref:hypothetical protein n=1 Tax=Acinetobacter gerneri TaxID=202952 RepID=UPI0028A8DBA5|nr:hypothetical protein [Acinetobacter gerneri]
MTEDEKINAVKLTPEQQKAFNRMKKAYADFQKLGGILVGHNEFQHALNGLRVSECVDDYLNTPSDESNAIKLDEIESESLVIEDPFIDASPWVILNDVESCGGERE